MLDTSSETALDDLARLAASIGVGVSGTDFALSSLFAGAAGRW